MSMLRTLEEILRGKTNIKIIAVKMSCYKEPFLGGGEGRRL